MERSQDFPKEMHFSAYINSPLRGLLLIAWMKSVLAEGVPMAVSVGIELDNKIARVSSNIL